MQNTHQDGIKKLALAQERTKELEDQVLKESLKRHKLALEHQKAAIEANSEHNRSLVELRAALGFVFGRVGMQDKERLAVASSSTATAAVRSVASEKP